MAEPIRRDKRRREDKRKERDYNSKELDPADFTKFMATLHDQNEVVLPYIENRIRKARDKKSPGTDGIHNEMLKLEVSAMVRVIIEIWRLVRKFQC